jgi:DnaK suppressor protein
MQEVELEHFKEVLERFRQDLLATDATGRDAAGTVILDQSSVGRLSRMDAMQGQAMAIEAQRRRELQLKRIELALARIAAGEYGVCMGCDEDIDPRRLEVDPTATLCIACASKQES